MELQELKSSIAKVNERVATLNNQRNRNIGMRENIQTQLQNAINSYKETYGVDVSTPELVNSEYNKVKGETEKQLQLLQGAISEIDNGNYAKANELLGVTPKAEPVVEQVQSEVTRPDIPVEQPVQVQSEVTPVVQVNEPVAPPTPVTPSTQPISGVEQTIKENEKLTGASEFLNGFSKPAVPVPPVAPPTMPVQVNEPVAPVPPVAPPTPSMPVATQEVKASEPVTEPSGFNPTSFGAILGGTEFQL